MVAVAACGGGSAADQDGVLITPVSAFPTATATIGPADLRGFAWPISGACLPKGDQLLPNAPRVYRNGIHEGVDFYAADNCTSIAKSTPVLAAKAGRVVRADLEYAELTRAELDKYTANPNSEEALDHYRGRQVWVDHGSGVVSRYCHLSAVAPGIVIGTTVTEGQVIANVGNSGTPESLTNPAAEMHLHFELRLPDGTYLGKSQPPALVRSLYQTLFSP